MQEAQKSVRYTERTHKGTLLLSSIYFILLFLPLGWRWGRESEWGTLQQTRTSFIHLHFVQKFPFRLMQCSHKVCPLNIQTRSLATVRRMCFWPHSRRWNGFVMIAHGSLTRYPVPEKMLVSISK